MVVVGHVRSISVALYGNVSIIEVTLDYGSVQMSDKGIYIGFFKPWLKLCPLTKPYNNPYIFTTIRPKEYSWRYLKGHIHAIHIRKKYAFDRILINKQFMTIADITHEIAKEDIDPCDNPLSVLKLALKRMYKRQPWYMGDRTKMALLTFKPEGYNYES